MKRRVVITGMGALTPFGVGVDPLWQGLIESRSGIKAIDSFFVDDLPTKIGGFIPKTFNPDLYVSPKEQRKIDKFILYALVAAEEAIKDSGWTPKTEEEQERTGVIVGSGIGGLQYIHDTAMALQQSSARKVTPFFIPASLINLSSGYISIRYGFKGPNHSVVTACATGAHAIGDGARIIQWDDADVMIAGGSEAALCRLGMAGFCAARALSTGFNNDPKSASRPWDKRRDGFVMGEGAGIVVLEELEHAKKRGAKIYAEILGYGLSGDGHHITAPPPNGEGAARAMRFALKRAELSFESIGYVNAHGTSTQSGDLAELNAIKTIFKDHVYCNKFCMSSTKSSIGHLLGAAGSIEAILSILALLHRIAPPTLNLDDPDDGCDINFVPHVPQDMHAIYAMSNSFGFGGTNASLVFGSGGGI